MGDLVKEHVKYNGCYCPFHPLQILSYITFIFYGYVFYFITIIVWKDKSTLIYTFSILYTTLYIIVVTIALIATLTDPSDPTVSYERSMKTKPRIQSGENEDYYLLCSLCKTRVLERTKHCGTCNRCVESFDHHCIWLNNCIGRRNYLFFLLLISFVGVFCLVQLAVNIITLTMINSKGDLLADFYNTGTLKIKAISYILLSLCTVTQIALMIFVVQLWLLHCWLIRHDLTTYDYVIYMRKKRKNPNVNIKIEDIRRHHKSKVIQRHTKNTFNEQKSNNSIDISEIKDTSIETTETDNTCLAYELNINIDDVLDQVVR